jgi:hypothetical protein
VKATDVLMLVARRTQRPDKLGCPDESPIQQEKALILALMSGVEAVRAELDATLDELAELAAQAGATNPERGAAVGISKQAAAKRWGNPGASRVARQ